MSQNRMERFSPIAQRVLKNAEQEAREFQQDAIYPHHLFLALLRESDGTANRVLRSYQLNYERVRPLVNLIVSGSYRGTYNPAPELTPQIKVALELSVDEARKMNHHYIGSEHLLLGLLNHLDDVMQETLDRLKMPAALLRDRTHEVLKSYSEAPNATPQQVTVSVPELPPTQEPRGNEVIRNLFEKVASGELSPEEAAKRLVMTAARESFRIRPPSQPSEASSETSRDTYIVREGLEPIAQQQAWRNMFAEERLQILNQVEAGELSPEEANVRLTTLVPMLMPFSGYWSHPRMVVPNQHIRFIVRNKEGDEKVNVLLDRATLAFEFESILDQLRQDKKGRLAVWESFGDVIEVWLE